MEKENEIKRIVKIEKQIITDMEKGESVEQDVEVPYLELPPIKQPLVREDEYIARLEQQIVDDDVEISRRQAHKAEVQAELDSILNQVVDEKVAEPVEGEEISNQEVI